MGAVRMSELSQSIENSRKNEATAHKLFEIETEILACQSSRELLKHLLDSIKSKFNFKSIHLLMVEPTPISYLLSGNLQTPGTSKIPSEFPSQH